MRDYTNHTTPIVERLSITKTGLGMVANDGLIWSGNPTTVKGQALRNHCDVTMTADVRSNKNDSR